MITSTDPAWDEACERLEKFLLAHRVAPRERMLTLALEWLREAQTLHATDPARDPITAALSLATARTDEWFSRLVADSGPADPLRAARGRAAYFSALAGKFPIAFLDPSPPSEALAALRSALFQAGPELEFQSLVRKEMDYGAMEDIAHETWEQFSWGHVLRAFALWVAVFFAAWAAYLKFFA